MILRPFFIHLGLHASLRRRLVVDKYEELLTLLSTRGEHALAVCIYKCVHMYECKCESMYACV